MAVTEPVSVSDRPLCSALSYVQAASRATFERLYLQCFGDSRGAWAAHNFSGSLEWHRLEIAVRAATKHHPELAQKRISPHSIRHATAMHLLQSGVDVSVIALWLGHESPITTHHYVEADLAMKDRALARLREPKSPTRRYRAPDSLLAFLNAL
jgi:integrase